MVCCYNVYSISGHIQTIRLFLASRPSYQLMAVSEAKFPENKEKHLNPARESTYSVR